MKIKVKHTMFTAWLYRTFVFFLHTHYSESFYKAPTYLENTMALFQTHFVFSVE